MWRFEGVTFDEASGRLEASGRIVNLDRSSQAILNLLIEAAGAPVGKEKLLRAGWPDRLVHENSLAKAIGRLREALGEQGLALKSVYGQGYRLAVHAEAVPAPVPVSQGQPASEANDPRARRTGVALAVIALGVAAAGLVGMFAISRRDPGNSLELGEAPDPRGRVLWVDDHPANNMAERRWLENQGIAVYAVVTTDEALALLAMYTYDAVISDMGRGDQPLAGLKLSAELRRRGDDTPLYIYTVMPSREQRRLVAQAGGNGVAVTPKALYSTVLPQIGKRTRQGGALLTERVRSPD
ncbi:conserved hypothetical protein [Altererythrobacter sp. B11]|uniref:winged helix-turn-helix domain-containing protein n=1 Tax=Altererythrobacter sp. B11 TaxID=2060312 RepID=UPI000DC70345|nr:winged helix-turn-helix domain-containing protein [Altererythrobacter sp. B11]BBC74250.1 conserved hypothetical protein [Altererythrobacter sp. B11]